MAEKCNTDSKAVLKIEIRTTGHDLLETWIYVNTIYALKTFCKSIGVGGKFK